MGNNCCCFEEEGEELVPCETCGIVKCNPQKFPKNKPVVCNFCLKYQML